MGVAHDGNIDFNIVPEFFEGVCIEVMVDSHTFEVTSPEGASFKTYLDEFERSLSDHHRFLSRFYCLPPLTHFLLEAPLPAFCVV